MLYYQFLHCTTCQEPIHTCICCYQKVCLPSCGKPFILGGFILLALQQAQGKEIGQETGSSDVGGTTQNLEALQSRNVSVVSRGQMERIKSLKSTEALDDGRKGRTGEQTLTWGTSHLQAMTALPVLKVLGLLIAVWHDIIENAACENCVDKLDWLDCKKGTSLLCCQC